MPIRLACPCGKSLQVSDEAAGKRAKCPACGKLLPVPAARVPGPETAPPAAAAIHFTPDEDEAEPHPQRKGEPEDDEDKAEPPGRRKRSSRTPLLVGLAAGAVLLLAGGLAYWLLSRGNKDKDKVAQKQAPAEVGQRADSSGNHLNLVPRDAMAFVSVRVGDLLNSGLGRLLQGQVARFGFGGPRQLEQALGMSLADIERVTFVMPDRNAVWAIISTAKPYDRQKFLQVLAPKAQQKQHRGKTYHVDAQQDTALHFVDDHLLVAGPEPGVLQFLGQSAQAGGDGPLGEALGLAQSHQIVAAVVPSPPVLNELKKAVPPELAAYQPLLAVRSAVLALDVGAGLDADLRLHYPGEAQAKEAQRVARSGLDTVRQSLAQLKPRAAPGQKGQADRSSNILDATLKNMPIEQQGSTVRVRAQADLIVIVAAVERLLPAVQKTRMAARRIASADSLKRLVLAMHDYHDANGWLPQHAIYSRDGKPLLSWRVALLPFIGEKELHKQFHLDEPWDSPHNKALLPRMPKSYATLGVSTAEPGMTYYQAFVGKGAVFDDNLKITLPSITDGTSNTMMLAEAAKPVPWTKPEDLPFTPEGPLPRLGGLFPDGFNAVFADGSAHWIKKGIPAQTLKALITRNGGEKVSGDW